MSNELKPKGRCKKISLFFFLHIIMASRFDTVVFTDDVGLVHGPIKTQFGYHLILINSRSD